jgi:hypothetical protein
MTSAGPEQPTTNGKEELNKLLSGNYFDATSTIRHYDTLRATFSSFLLSALALMGAFFATQSKGGNPQAVRTLAIIAMLLALLGVLVAIKLDGLIDRQRLRARASIRILEEATGVTAISKVDQEVRERSNALLSNVISLNALWVGLFVAMLVLFTLAAIFPERLVVP